MDNLVALITGATSGIGMEAAKAIASTGIKVVITARDMEKGLKTQSDILQETGYRIEVLKCDLASQQSILAVILLTRLLASKPEYQGIRINCMHPGLVNTSLGRHGGRVFNAVFTLFGKPAAKGADTLLYMALWPKIQNISGEYFVNRKLKRTTRQSYDMQAAEKLLGILESKRIV